MGFVNRVLWILKALWTVLSAAINILKILQKHYNFQDVPEIVTIGLCI